MTQIRTSSIPYAKAALVKLAERTYGDDDQVEVFYGPASGAKNQIVVFGALARPADQSWATLGDRQRGEEYGLWMYIEVARGDLTQLDASERVFELLAMLEDGIRDDVHIGLAQQFRSIEAQVMQVQDFYEWPDPDGEGYGARIDTVIAIKTRI